ncbi:MAG: hypothetical protein JXA69_04025 [Phycisphaerae bacterium]|nr:hypothetical protein [Phycisphaerae bacterium]
MLRRLWLSVQRWRWPSRWAIKCGFVGAVVFFTLYPRPGLFVRHIGHLGDMNALVEPDSPALQPWAAELAAIIPADADDETLRQAVEAFVVEKVCYAFDWVTWGAMDYLPTVAEVVAQGREDCDGRAVVAASLLRRYDPTAALATDFKHMWVVTATGSLMRPSGPTVLVATPIGLRTDWLRALNVRGLAYGIAVFPLWRQMIIFVAVWLALCDPRMRPGFAFVAALVAVHGLLVVRLAAVDPWQPRMWGIWLGLAQVAVVVVLVVSAARQARQQRAAM